MKYNRLSPVICFKVIISILNWLMTVKYSKPVGSRMANTIHYTVIIYNSVFNMINVETYYLQRKIKYGWKQIVISSLVNISKFIYSKRSHSIKNTSTTK